MGVTRVRADRCPGVLRPWPAADGALVRIRLVGGAVSATALRALAEIAEAYGDGDLHLTRRANLQLRALPTVGGRLEPTVVDAIETTGLLPVRSHELVRNVMASPLSGVTGGRVDVRPLAAELDAGLCADPELAGLPARFLFLLDDGRGDLVGRRSDLAAVALSTHEVQLRVGDHWGPVLPLREAVPRLLDLARAFVRVRGSGPDAPWHVAELDQPLPGVAGAADPRLPGPAHPLAFGPVPGTELTHVAAPDGVLGGDQVARLTDGGDRTLVVTPWRGILASARRGRSASKR